MMGYYCREMLGPLVEGYRIVNGRPRQRGIEMVFGRLEVCRSHPEVLLGLLCGLYRRWIVGRKKTRLKLADPIPTLWKGQLWNLLQMLF
jgi:hypothetical protein